MGYLLCLLALVTLLLGMPISFAMGTIGLAYLLANGFALITIAQKVYTGMDSFLLLAIPFFLLAGALMDRGGIAPSGGFAFTLVGHVPGGLGHVTVVANLIMAGMSGTAAADAVAWNRADHQYDPQRLFARICRGDQRVRGGDRTAGAT